MSSKKKSGKKICMVSSEMAPYIKTGGLADVVEALSDELSKRGHDVCAVIPKYTDLNLGDSFVHKVIAPMGVWLGGVMEWCSVFMIESKAGVKIYLIEHHGFFSRHGVYHDSEMNDFLDNPRRFAFLSRAATQLCKDIGFSPDIIHSHDWQSALTPAYMKIWHWNDPIISKAASVLTIHNAKYQGIYSFDNYAYTGLGSQNFSPDTFECFGAMNFLKGGIFFSDLVTTVSPGYAEEIRAPYSDSGLAPYLSNKADSFYGILNGVDYSQWSPENDKYIASSFTADDLSGKKKCRKDLQKRFLLEENDDVPILGVVGRLVDQKGYYLLGSIIERVLKEMAVQFVLLGSGASDLQWYFGSLPARYPGKVGAYIGYSNELAHIIEAGSDIFLMPSLFEPCGLNQMYSLRYGTLPLVRATGGLNDTVENYDEKTGKGTGFKFYDATSDALYYTIGWAVSTYYDRKEHFLSMRKEAMKRYFGWDKAADEYEKAYDRAIQNKKNYDKSCGY